MENKASITRMALAVFAALKLILGQFGIEIPQDAIDAVVDIVAALCVIYTAYKNQNISDAAVQAQKYLNKLKQ